MASKRQRDEAEEILSEGEDLKRQKSYNQLVSLLEEEEEEAMEDLSSIITTLQQEIQQTHIPNPNSNPNPNTNSSSSSQPQSQQPVEEDYTDFFSSPSSSSVNSPNSMKELEEEERERVMRHLLEASDDELGIPNGEFFVGDEDEGVMNGGVALCGDALWEFEDEAANYYTLFQSHLFM